MLKLNAPHPARRAGRAVLRGLRIGGVFGAPFVSPLGAQRAAQTPAVWDPTWLGATAGSEAETYLRAAQVAGLVPLGTLSIRPLGPGELRALTAGLARADSLDGTLPVRGRGLARGRRARAALLPVAGSLAYTTGYPWATGEGPVWEGRGATGVLRAGAAGGYGPVTLVVQPVAFLSENRAFTLTPNSEDPTGPRRYDDFLLPEVIDRPQRFGDGRYGRVDAGSSTLRVDLGPFAAGASTSPQGWGPAVVHPLLLGPNAGGFRHLFVGTSRPAWVGIGRVHVRSVVGRLDESRVYVGRRGRVASGAVVVFTPRGLPGLEVGGARFYHLFSPPERVSLRALGRPYEGIFVNSQRPYDLSGADSTFQTANQLASGFVSWTFPRGGFRAYGEFLRNDNPISGRDLFEEPDHSSAYMLGLQRAYRTGAGPGAVLTSVRAELVNARTTRLSQVRTQTGIYSHIPIQQGHTQRGQLLGSVAAMGGAGAQLAVDRYARGGRWSLVLDRLQRAKAAPYTEAAPPEGYDVEYAASVQRVWRRGPLALTAEGTVIRELNRDFTRDVWNARGRTGVAWTF